METKVVTYKSPTDYSRDVKRQQKQGWQPVDSQSFLKRRSVTGSVLVPFSLLRGRKSQLVITYQRESSAGYTLVERVKSQQAAVEQQIAESKANDPNSRAGEYIGPKWMGVRRLR